MEGYYFLFFIGVIIGNFIISLYHIFTWKDKFFVFIRLLIFCFFPLLQNPNSFFFCNKFRLNLTLNRDESPDEYAEEVEDIKPIQPPPQKSSTKKAPPLRSRSVLGCDQIGIETLVSMINGESDSEKEDGPMQQQQQPVPPVIKNEPPPQRIRANMLRKTGIKKIIKVKSLRFVILSFKFHFKRMIANYKLLLPLLEKMPSIISVEHLWFHLLVECAIHGVSLVRKFVIFI